MLTRTEKHEDKEQGTTQLKTPRSKITKPHKNDPTVTKWIKSCLLPCFGTFKMPFLMFISILVFRPEGQIWNPVRRETRFMYGEY